MNGLRAKDLDSGHPLEWVWPMDTRLISPCCLFNLLLNRELCICILQLAGIAREGKWDAQTMHLLSFAISAAIIKKLMS